MTEGEKKAIEDYKRVIAMYFKYSDYDLFCSNLMKSGVKGTIQNTMADMINLIEKLQKENEDYEKARKDGTLSDGYHTYNDLYYQRCVLFAAICNTNKNISWKSKRHNDGKKCFDSDNWFIVGIDTPKGSYTYHYEMKYWDLFEVQELELGKEWDGHTDKDVTRLLSLINNNIPKDKIKELIKKDSEIDKVEFEDDEDLNYERKIIDVDYIEELLEEE